MAGTKTKSEDRFRGLSDRKSPAGHGSPRSLRFLCCLRPNIYLISPTNCGSAEIQSYLDQPCSGSILASALVHSSGSEWQQTGAVHGLVRAWDLIDLALSGGNQSEPAAYAEGAFRPRSRAYRSPPSSATAVNTPASFFDLARFAI